MSNPDSGASRYQQARERALAKAREQAAARAERRAGRAPAMAAASGAAVSYLWLVQTYIVRALCLLLIVGTGYEYAVGHPVSKDLMLSGVAVFVFVGETVWARAISAAIVKLTGKGPWGRAAKASEPA